MATTAQIIKLRKKIQDFYDKRSGAQLNEGDFAFKDDELFDIIDDAVAEATDGLATAEDISAYHESLSMLIARADAILQIAQDESRRIKWQTNNEIVDPTKVGENLLNIAKELRQRFKDSRDRKLKENVEGVANRPAGGNLRFNDSVKTHGERNFDNRTVQRNRSSDHGY